MLLRYGTAALLQACAWRWEWRGVYSLRLHKVRGSERKRRCLIIDSYKSSSEITRRCNTSHRIPTGAVFSKERKSFSLCLEEDSLSCLLFSFKGGKLCRSQITWLWGVIGNWSSFIPCPDTRRIFQEQARCKPSPQLPVFHIPEQCGRLVNYFKISPIFCSSLFWLVKYYIGFNLFWMDWIYQIIEIDILYLHASDRLVNGFAVSSSHLLLEWRIWNYNLYNENLNQE